MNAQQRKILAGAVKALQEANEKMEEARSTIEQVKDEEQDKLGNLNEGQLAGPMGERLAETAETTEAQHDELETAIDNLNDVISSIESIVGEVEGL